MLLVVLTACNWGTPDAPPPAPTPVPPPAEPMPLPEPRVGVSEVVTPPGLLRPTEVQDRAGITRYDVSVDAAQATVATLGDQLRRWGFTVEDGDGETWRVVPPEPGSWAERLEPLPSVLRVQEVLDREPLADGAFRAGSERYGDVAHTWSWREGGPVESVTGLAAPPAPVLPTALPPAALACLAPLRDDLETGVSVGHGWERALQKAPATWAVVLEDYGFCQARGWILLTAEAPVADLAFGGRPAATLDDAGLSALAVEALKLPRAETDPRVEAAVAALADGPVELLADAARTSGTARTALIRAWHARAPDDTMAWASGAAATDAEARALLVAEDAAARDAALADPVAPPVVELAALSAWRPSPGQEPPFLERLRGSADARVRTRAWEHTIEARSTECADKARAVTAADAAAVWARCPDAATRAAAAKAAGPAAVDLARATALAPETVESGIAAVRALGDRQDALATIVTTVGAPRDVRRVALQRLFELNAPDAQRLAEKHGAWLGFEPPATPAMAEDPR